MLTHCFDFLREIISWNTLLAIKMAAAFGKHLIFNMKCCRSCTSVLDDRPNRVFFFPVTSVCIGHHGESRGVNNLPDGPGEFGEAQQTSIRNARHVRCGSTRDVHRFEVGLFGHSGHQGVEHPRADQGLRLLEAMTERRGGGGHGRNPREIGGNRQRWVQSGPMPKLCLSRFLLEIVSRPSESWPWPRFWRGCCTFGWRLRSGVSQTRSQAVFRYRGLRWPRFPRWVAHHTRL